MVLGDFSDLARRTASDKIFDDKAFNIAKSPKYDGYQRGLVWMIYNFDDKKTGQTVKNENISYKEFAEQLCKPILEIKVHSTFIDNTWGAQLANMHSMSKFNKGIHFLLNVIDIYSKYVLVIYLKDKKGITITNAFQKTLRWIQSQTKQNMGR